MERKWLTMIFKNDKRVVFSYSTGHKFSILHFYYLDVPNINVLDLFVGVLTVNDMRFNSFIEFMKMFISVTSIAQVLESLKTWKILALVKLNMGVVYILQRQLCSWSSTNYTTC